MKEELEAQLIKWRQAKLYRLRRVLENRHGCYVVSEGKRYLSFASNDYLGLAQDPRVIKAAKDALDKYGLSSSASAAIAGCFSVHQAAEEALAAFVGAEKALLFSTGYMANQAVIHCLLASGGAVVADKLSHASFWQAVKGTTAKIYRYRHADLHSLARYLQRSEMVHPRVIASEGVFSMDGDIADLTGIQQCLLSSKAWLLVDDAHGIGVLGTHGSGTLDHLGCAMTSNTMVLGVLGKAIGSFGAFVAGEKTLIEHLTQFAKSYVYTTAMPPMLAAATCESLALLHKDYSIRQRLWDNINYFKAEAASLGLPIANGDAAIQTLIIGQTSTALQIGNRLLELGIWVPVIRPPTVAKGSARLRISLTALHDQQDIDRLLHTVKQTLKLLHTKHDESEIVA